MSYAKHTQGPWQAYDRGIGWEVHAGGFHGSDGKCTVLCRGAINDEFRETFTEADARLIAATPDLLKVVESFARAMNNGANSQALHKCLQLANKAIAKATGATQ